MSLLVFTIASTAQEGKFQPGSFFHPGNLAESRSVYDKNPNNVQVGEILPPNCAGTTGGCSASTGVPFDGTHPLVWNNDAYDGSFGITSKIFLDQIFPFGVRINTLENTDRSLPKNTSSRFAKRVLGRCCGEFHSRRERSEYGSRLRRNVAARSLPRATVKHQVPLLAEGRDVGHSQGFRQFAFPLEPTR